MQFKQVVWRLKPLFNTATVRHSFVAGTGTAINGVLGLIYFFLLAAKLSPADYGRFSIAVALTAVGFSLFSFGLDQAVIKYKPDDKKISTIVYIRLFVSFLVSILPFIFINFRDIFVLVGIGIGSKLLFSLVVSFLQARQEYWTWSIYFVATNFIRLTVSYFVPQTDPYFHFAVYSLIPALAFVWFAAANQLPKISFSFKTAKNLLAFNLPLTISSLISSLNSKTDSFFIAGFQGFAAAGLYDLSVQISSSISQLVTAYSAAIAPKYSSLDSLDKNKLYLKKNILFSLVVALFLIPAMLLVGFVLFTYSGKNFSQSLPLLLPLLAGYAVFFASVPLRDSLLYFFGDSKIFTYLSVFNLILSVLSGIFLIRPYGPIAAAGSFLFVQIISVIILIFQYVKNYRSHSSQK